MVKYPELRGKVVDAEALMAYIFENHYHPINETGDGDPVVRSLLLELWLRHHAK
jgi:hypothetical protein